MISMLRLSRSRLRVAAVAWVLFAGFAFASIGWAGMLALKGQTYVSNLEFVGELTYGGQSVSVIAPKSTWVDKIHVAEGDMVVAGQVLASLNTNALELALESAQEDILVARYHRTCLLANLSEDSLPKWNTQHPPEIAAKLQVTASQCAMERAALETPRAEEESQLLLLRERYVLFSKHLTLLGANTQGTPQSMADRAVKILLAQNELQKRINELEAVVDQNITATSLQIVARSQALSERISRLRQKAIQLENLTSDPNLIAPSTGRIVQMHLPQPGRPLLLDSVVFEITPSTSPKLSVSIMVPNQDAEDVVDGQSAMFQITRPSGRIEWVAGVLEVDSSLQGDGVRFRHYTLHPNAEDIDRLALEIDGFDPSIVSNLTPVMIQIAPKNLTTSATRLLQKALLRAPYVQRFLPQDGI